MMVTGTRRRRHNQRQQHQECREPEHRPEHPFRRFFDHGALTPEAIEIVGLLLKNVRELQEFAALGSETASPGYFAEACGDREGNFPVLRGIAEKDTKSAGWHSDLQCFISKRKRLYHEKVARNRVKSDSGRN